MTMQSALLRAPASERLLARIKRDIVAYWPMDEAAGATRKAALLQSGALPSAFDMIDHNTIAQVAGPSVNLPLAAGFTAASSQYLSAAVPTGLMSSPVGGQDYTVAGWFFRNGAQPLADPLLIGQYDFGGGKRTWGIVLTQATNGLHSRWCNDGAGATFTPAVVPTDVAWRFVVASYNAARGQGFISVSGASGDYQAGGVGLATVSTENTIFTTDGLLAIGAYVSSGTPTLFFQGSLCHWGIWRRLLNPIELAALYNNGQGRDLRKAA